MEPIGRRAGLTLLEVLLALSLLSALVMGSAFWLGEAARAQVEVAEPLRWEMAARASLQRIQDDLLVGDVITEPGEKRVEVGERELSIETRSPRSAEARARVTYRVEPSGALVRIEAAPDGGASGSVRQVLFEGLGSFRCERKAKSPLFRVAIGATNGAKQARSFLEP